MWSSLVIGLITNYAWKSGQAMHLASNMRIAAEILSGPSLALFYACALALMMQSDFWRKWIGVLRWPGRMALTNYIAQTTIVTAIYYGWGFGLMKKTTTLQAVATAISVFAVLTAASAVWLHYFQFGPLEWLRGLPRRQSFSPFDLCYRK